MGINVVEQNVHLKLQAFVVSISINSGKLPGLITASGELKANKSVNVSPKRQGILYEIFVEEGDEVKKGDPKPDIEPPSLST